MNNDSKPAPPRPPQAEAVGPVLEGEVIGSASANAIRTPRDPRNTGLARLADRLIEAAIYHHDVAAEASILQDARWLAEERIEAAETASEARIRLAEIELEEASQLQEIQTERSLRHLLTMLTAEQGRALQAQVIERQALLDDCAAVRSPEAGVEARLAARIARARARRLAHSEESALAVERRVARRLGRAGGDVAARAAARERYLREAEEHRRQRTSRPVEAGPNPAAAPPLEPMASDRKIEGLAQNLAALLRDLAPADQERVERTFRDSLHAILPPLATEETIHRAAQILDLMNGKK